MSDQLNSQQTQPTQPEANPTPCRRDCAFFSTYTDSCDYTLINYRARPCSAHACTEYKLRETPRSWQIFTARQPRNERCVTADCGHEVYAGDGYYERDGKTACVDCLDAEITELETDEKARLLGFSPRVEVQV